ncbi:hypothetical protein BOX15_Mlig009493g3, partial [Macrostomum lignano]
QSAIQQNIYIENSQSILIMSDPEFGSILVGTNVDIQRTDGRIHSAIVSGINRDSHSVTVEWFERGEAKGKEIELEAIFQLNPGLAPADGGGGGGGGGANIGGGGSIDYGVNGGGVGNASEANVGASFSHREPAGPAAQQQPAVAAAAAGPGSKGRPTAIPSARGAGSQPKQQQQQQPAARYAPPPPPVEPQDSIDEDDYGGQAETSPTREERGAARRGGGGGGGGAAAGGGAGGGAAAGGGRKSNVVKEIERIQQRRDERRAAQQAKKSDPDYDPSNPQFEFLQMIREFQSTLDYRPITNDTPIEIHQICVCVRKRPLNKKELTKKEIDVVTIPNKENVLIHEPKLKVDLTKYLENQQFRFDYAFDQRIDNLVVYKYTAQPLVECIFEGGMATCFAYGQTGSGKTHTMGGDFTGKGQQDCARGIYALAARDVFKLLNSKYKGQGLYVEAAFFEIYSGKVFDLLNKKAKLRVLEDGKNIVQIVGLLEERVNNVEEVLDLLKVGHATRTSGQTSANQHSSRSHAVFQLILRKGQARRMHGKFSLIDLAGNERGADTNSADRVTRMEGAEINKSLLALKECIRALGRKGAHLPFRGSKLTQVLRDSFIGEKARTCMIATISPGFSSCEHTLNTLRYADRVKELGPGGPISGAGAGGEPAAAPGGDYEQQFLGDFESGGGGDDLIGEEDDNWLVRSAVQETGEAEDDEYTGDLVSFHKVVSHMERMEEEVNDDHKALLDGQAGFGKEMKRLYDMSGQVDYNQDDYANRLDTLLANQMQAMQSLREKLAAWQAEMRREEELSTKLQAMKSNKTKAANKKR